MNILFVSSGYVPSISGIAISTDHFRRGLEKLGHKVWVVAPTYPLHVDHDPRVHRVPTVKNPRYPEYPLSLFFASGKLKKKFGREKIDLVHTMQPFTVGRFAKKIARHLDVPLVFTHHTRYDLYAHYLPLPRRIARPLVQRSVKRFANNCDALVAPSASTKDMMQKENMVRPICVVPTGLMRSMKISTPKEVLRTQLGLAKDKLVLLCVSRISIKDKNLLLLLRAYKTVHAQLPNALLVLVGGGPDLPRLKSEVRRMNLTEAVRFVGYVHHRDVDQYYSAADLFVYPSVSETQGIITLEALSAGLPVVAVRAPGTSDVVTEGRNGLLTDNNAEELAHSILVLAKDAALRQRMSQAALASAEPFSAARSAEKLLAVYHEALARHRRRLG